MTSTILLEASYSSDSEDVTEVATPLTPSLTTHSSESDGAETASNASDSDTTEYWLNSNKPPQVTSGVIATMPTEDVAKEPHIPNAKSILDSHVARLAMQAPPLDSIGAKEDINMIIATIPMPEPTKTFVQQSLDQFTSNMNSQRNKVGIMTILRTLLPQLPTHVTVQLSEQAQENNGRRILVRHWTLRSSQGNTQHWELTSTMCGRKNGWTSAICLGLALSRMVTFNPHTQNYYKLGSAAILNKAYYPDERSIYGTPLLPTDTVDLTVEDFLRRIESQ